MSASLCVTVLVAALGDWDMAGVRIGVCSFVHSGTFLAIWFFAGFLAMDVDLSG